MKRRVTLASVGSGDNGKTTALIAIGYQLVKRGYPVCMVSFDPEPENSLVKLMRAALPKDQKMPKLTITDLLKMPGPWSDSKRSEKLAADLATAVDEATINFPSGFGVIRCDVSLINYEVEGGDIYGLMRLVKTMAPGFVLIDCAAGTGGFSMLSAVAAADYLIGVSKPSAKSISIARRAVGLDIAEGDEMSLPEVLSGEDETSGYTFGAKYAGMIGNMFQGAKWEDGEIKIASSGISSNIRDFMNQIIDTPGFLDFVPWRTGADQREVVKAYERITDKLLSIVLS